MAKAKEEPKKYIRLNDGTIYGHTDELEKRRDATVVDENAAAQWFHKQGIKNEITDRAGLSGGKKSGGKTTKVKDTAASKPAKSAPAPAPEPEPETETPNTEGQTDLGLDAEVADLLNG